jgi:hypothetical protein
MKAQTLFQFGALATFLTAVGVTVANLIYFFGSVNTVFYIWWSTIIYVLWVFAYFALFAVQARRVNVFLFTGFVLLIFAVIFALLQNTGDSLVTLGFVTEAQFASGNNSTIAAVNFISQWTYVIGSLIFGFGVLRAELFSRWAGILFMLLGVLWIFNESQVVFAIYAVLLTITWGWLSLSIWRMTNSLLTDKRQLETAPSVNAPSQ